jgi:hypothetical protein
MVKNFRLKRLQQVYGASYQLCFPPALANDCDYKSGPLLTRDKEGQFSCRQGDRTAKAKVPKMCSQTWTFQSIVAPVTLGLGCYMPAPGSVSWQACLSALPGAPLPFVSAVDFCRQIRYYQDQDADQDAVFDDYHYTGSTMFVQDV